MPEVGGCKPRFRGEVWLPCSFWGPRFKMGLGVAGARGGHGLEDGPELCHQGPVMGLGTLSLRYRRRGGGEGRLFSEKVLCR